MNTFQLLIFKAVMFSFYEDTALPVLINFTFSTENAILGDFLVITCEAFAVPVPKYTIIHNGTKVISIGKKYIIAALGYSHAGSYKCIAENNLGKLSKTIVLSVHGKA